MSAELIFFVLFALGALAGSLGVVINRQPINSAISLVVSFFFLAGIYILLNAEFMAVLQIMVYAGAIMMLFIFVLMLINVRADELGKARTNVTKLAALVAAATIGVFLAASIRGHISAGSQVHGPSFPSEFGTVKPIGRLLLTDFVLPFEMAAVLLLVGIVGAVVVAKKRL